MYTSECNSTDLEETNMDMKMCWNELLKSCNITEVGVFKASGSIINNPNFDIVQFYLNKNYCIVIAFEWIWLIPKQCLFRWEYFEKISLYRGNKENIINTEIFNITQVLIDSYILKSITYSDLCLLPDILNSSSDDVKTRYIPNSNIIKFRPFLDILIPPMDFWN
jgi:hypothetical protein